MKYPEIPSEETPAFDPPIPTPLGYHLIVEPQEPDDYSAGGIALASKTKLANRLTTTLGKVRAVGPLCFRMRKDGFDFAEEQNWPEVGDWCIFRLHAGQKLRIRLPEEVLRQGADDQRFLLLLADTDIIGRIDEADLKSFYSWA